MLPSQLVCFSERVLVGCNKIILWSRLPLGRAVDEVSGWLCSHCQERPWSGGLRWRADEQGKKWLGFLVSAALLAAELGSLDGFGPTGPVPALLELGSGTAVSQMSSVQALMEFRGQLLATGGGDNLL